MSTWVRAIAVTYCGRCQARIERGDPVRLLTLAKLKRCVACAGEPAPELPRLEERRADERRQPSTDRRSGDRRGTTERLGDLPIAARADRFIRQGSDDWKTRQVGEHE